MYAPITTLPCVGAEAVSILANRVSQINVQTRFMVDDDTWPPEQPTSFTPLLLVHYQGNRTLEQVTAMAELTYTGDISKVASVTSENSAVKHNKRDGHEKFHKIFDTTKATKEIIEILAPLENKSAFILIEGAPGIGKSVLLKEISYRWAIKELLQKFELVLLVSLRDPSLQQIESVDDLLHLFYKREKNSMEIVDACSKYLSRNGGENLALLLDGYDEYPDLLKQSSLIADILKRQVLPLCGLVVSSRPHASESLRKQATIKVDILGFTETEREQYIKQALPDQPDKIEELTEYLHQQPSVDSICFIPFNMAILLYLFKLGIPLPSNSTELYHHFICSTITRHLSKFGNPLTSNKITNLADLPEPCNRIVKQLSKLSLEAINNNKLIFTLDEITAACPDIAATPRAINGFGLLQAVQHFGLYAKTMTLNFIHFTVQEYLAALYISYLPPNEEVKVIEANFWSNIHFNMFSIYISLTKGQRSSFKKFLSGENEAIAIADEFLTNQLKCLRLYHCFKEANNETLCNTIERAEVFNDKEINLGRTTLTGSDIECVSLFLASSFNKEWEGLHLYNCYIQDKGLNTLWRGLRHTTDITINTLWLDSNGLTVQSSSLISELTVRMKVKLLVIAGNETIGEDQQLYTMLSNPSSVLEILCMWGTQLSSTAATDLFTSLRNNHKLKELNIADNDITDDACDAITEALKSNSCLVTLSMYSNPLSSEAIVTIVQCLKANDTLQLIGLPDCPQATKENIRSLQEVVNNKRASRGCQVKLEIKFSYV